MKVLVVSSLNTVPAELDLCLTSLGHESTSYAEELLDESDILLVFLTPDLNHQTTNLILNGITPNKIRVIGLFNHKKNEVRVPVSLDKIADAIVCWEKVDQALQGINLFTDINCNSREKQPIKRHKC